MTILFEEVEKKSVAHFFGGPLVWFSHHCRQKFGGNWSAFQEDTAENRVELWRE